MFKKTLLGAVILMGLVSGLNAVSYIIPSDYTFVKSVNYGALQIYKKGNIYVSIVNLSKAKVNVGNVDKASSNQFVKHSLNYWWNDVSNSNILGMYNGQFFSMNGYGSSSTTTLSFPLRSYWSNINTGIDSGSLRILLVDNYGNVKIFGNYSSSYLFYSKELIVGLHPYINKGYYNSTGRFYMVGIPYNFSERNSYNRNMKYLLFFTAISASQNTIYNEISKWNAVQRDIVMMDGSGSAQMRVGNLKVYGNGFPAYRHLPNVITIEKK